MSIIQEFKKFAMRGNVIDLAVGIIIGAAFGKITNSLVDHIIMPPIGLIMGQIDLTSYKIVLRDAVPAEAAAGGEALPAVAISYGLFLNALLNFLIVAFCVFLLVKAINKTRDMMEDPDQADPLPNTRACPQCCSMIPIKARRCPQCTSEVPPPEEPTEQPAAA